MKIIKPEIIVETEINGKEILQKLEKYGRTCYKSENKITENSASRFILKILNNGHESILEHISITVRVICDRGISHEIVRHRIASYTQESTRYCNYSNDEFNKEIIYIQPCFWNKVTYKDNVKRVIWKKILKDIEEAYMKLIELGASAQEARSILPNSLKTELIMTMNLREWRHFFKIRCSDKAHPQMREIANMIKEEFINKIPIIFDEFENHFEKNKIHSKHLLDKIVVKKEMDISDETIRMIEEDSNKITDNIIEQTNDIPSNDSFIEENKIKRRGRPRKNHD